MKTILISEQTDSRLKALARPLEDTHDTVIERLLDFYDSQETGGALQQVMRHRPERTLDPLNPPSLTHTKVISASIDGKNLQPANWNALLDEALRIARRSGGKFDFVKKYTSVNIVDGKKTDEGYRYLDDIKFSVQGQDANDAWRAVALLARKVGFSVEVHFFWRQRQGAAQPGESGMFKLEAADISKALGRASQ